MKQNLLRVGCAALSLSMAAGLLASCSVLPQPSAPASRPAQQEQDAPKNYDAASLKDGKLRILYSYNAPGGNTILCGDTVLRQSPVTETSYLLTDHITGETNYYFCQWSDNSTASVPENAYTCVAAGDRLAFGIYAPGDAVPDEENDDLYQYSAVQIQERDGTVVYRNDHAAVLSVTVSNGDASAPTDWLEIDTYSDDGSSIEQTSLLNATTGEERSGFAAYLSAGVASFQSENGTYQLVDLTSTGQSEVLCEFEDPISAYAPGVAVTYRQDLGDYELHDLNTGDVLEVRDESLGTDTLAVYAKNGTLRVYDQNTGAVLTDTVVAPIEGLQRTDLYNVDSGWVWLRQYDNDYYEVTTSTICGPNGTNKTLDLDAIKARYGADFHGYLWPVTAAGGEFYLSVSYQGPGQNWLYDLIDSTGNVVLAGLGSCNGYYTNTANPLPDGVFVARKGFEYGWMDLHGQWVYCQNIFYSSGDDAENYYF